ncbi:ATP-binding protein [Nocardia coubleae]|uniref:ATP-binding protein n=1 Tax=Nocardia coubleae TaxID=356147 RepID=A0A846W506_9NOCA|nr:ATP-binding protein [Nocardia coubleae]
MALVVASQCEGLGRIEHIDTLAGELLTELRELGGWMPVTADGAPLVDPGHVELRHAVSSAFTTAKRQQATLLVSFIGHGHYDPEDRKFFLLAKDSLDENTTEVPDRDKALDLGSRIQTDLKRNEQGRLDGLVMLVDACASGRAINVAGSEWFTAIPRNAARMELLTASADDAPAFNACFTRTIINTLRTGDPTGPSQIFVETLRTPIARGCTNQDPGHLSLTMSGAAQALRGGDPGLWLVPNRARSDCLTGRPSAGLVDQLTRDLLWTRDVARTIRKLVTHEPPRLRLLIGPAGSGKSAIMGMLVRATRPELIPPKYIHAAVFLDATSSPLTVAEELATQLGHTLPGFAAAAARTANSLTEEQQRTLGALDRLVVLPFAKVASDDPVHIVIDGLDQPDPGNREALVAAIGAVTTDESVSDLCVIAGIRQGTRVDEDPRLAHGFEIFLELPTARTVVEATFTFAGGLLPDDNGLDDLVPEDTTVGGGWLISRLFTEVSQLPDNWTDTGDSTLNAAIAQRITDASASASASEEDQTPTYATHIDRILAILAAAGVGPVLPLDLAGQALNNLGTPLSPAELRDLLASLGVLVARSAASTADERIGLAHLAFAEPIERHLEIDMRTAHRAIADTLGTKDPQQSTLDYRARSGARHLARAGRAHEALVLVYSLQGNRAADNLALWTALLPEIDPADHREVVVTRNNIAQTLGQTGDTDAALKAFRSLLADEERTFGTDHRSTLIIRNNIAGFLGETGNPNAALVAFRQLLSDQERILGPDHPDALRTRHNIAAWLGETGNPNAALTAYHQLLPDHERILGPLHPTTLHTQQNIAAWLGRSGDPSAALAALLQLLPDLERVLGPDHPATLIARGNIASWLGETGEVSQALTTYRQLLPDLKRTLGLDHPDTLDTRDRIAFWLGRSGAPEAQLAVLRQLLLDRERILGSGHPETQNTRKSIAYLETLMTRGKDLYTDTQPLTKRE